MKDREGDLLDRALAGQPPEVKARVLDIVLRLGLDPSDDLFVVMIAFGFLQVLLEDYPATLTTLFDDFYGDLSSWSNQSLQILESLSQKAKTEEALAYNSTALLKGLEKLTDICSVLMAQLPTSPMSSLNSPAASSTSKGLDNWATIIRQDIQHQNAQLMLLVTKHGRELSETTKLLRWLRWWLIVQGAGIGAILLVLLLKR